MYQISSTHILSVPAPWLMLVDPLLVIARHYNYLPTLLSDPIRLSYLEGRATHYLCFSDDNQGPCRVKDTQ